jgi:hypothetical protein
VKQIVLTRGYFTLIDDDDYDAIVQYSWHPGRSGQGVYAHTTIGRQTLSMHRLIMQPGPGLVVDHLNCNGLDNRRENLRVCTQAENVRRRRPHGKGSKYRGVSRTPGGKPWTAMIRVNNKQKNLGRFLTEEEAARVYDSAAFQAWGPSTYLNFPAEQLAIADYYRFHPLAKRGG